MAQRIRKGGVGMVREAREGDLQELLELYQYLHEKETPGPSGS